MWGRTLVGVLSIAVIALGSTQAWSGTKFGSRLNRQATPPEFCQDGAKKSNMCSWVLTEAQNAPGREKAPKTGTIDKIRILACAPGTFVLQIARANAAVTKARAIRSGPTINYKGAAKNCTASSGFVIETFDVDVPVQKGDYLSVVATRVAFIYNSGGDALHFDPPLADGGALRGESNVSAGGVLMLEAEYTN